jgi:hypothetical protein
VRGLIGFLGVALLVTVLWDAFETVVLPRHVTRSFRIARLFFRFTWRVWKAFARSIRSNKNRETYLSIFGPLSMLLLLAFWATMLMLAFAMLLWAGGAALSGSGGAAPFLTDLYFSGTTFFTLGLGDVLPLTRLARVIAVCEAGTGFGFLAIMIAYLPTLYGGLSQREVNISLLDARAGSPPTAAELLRRHGRQRVQESLASYLREWEIGSAQLMETHLTYPFLCFFRSQHDNQSWLAAFTAILDVCALLIAYGDGETKWQAQLTFAISRHAVADLSEILRTGTPPPVKDRLPAADLPKVRSFLIECGLPKFTESGDLKLRELRDMYEPHLEGLSRLLWMPLPSWGVERIEHAKPTMWERITSPARAVDVGAEIERRHF